MPRPVAILAAVLAGIAGTIANSAVVAATAPPGFLALALAPGRIAVAVGIAALLIPGFSRIPGLAGWVAGLAGLTLIPSILAKTVFGIEAVWPYVLFVNAVYAGVACAVFAAIAGGPARPV